jgi:hypothetical protein
LAQANAVLACFCSDYNQRFARPPADHTVTLGANRLTLPPLPGQRGYAGETIKLAPPLDGMLRVYRGNTLRLALPLPLAEYADRRPALLTTAQKGKNPMPRIYTLSARLL